MVTNQIMKREFYNGHISQRTKDGFFNATELLQNFNSISCKSLRFKEFWENKNTKQFIEVLENELHSNGDNSPYLKPYETTRGNKGSTWMHPYLFVKFAMWLSPELELKVIKWVYDNLIDFRIQAGDHYKDMCKAISESYYEWCGKNPDPLIFVREAHFLNNVVFGNPKGNQRNDATPQQLDLMNKLQLANIKMIRSKVDKNTRYQNLIVFKNLYV